MAEETEEKFEEQDDGIYVETDGPDSDPEGQSEQDNHEPDDSTETDVDWESLGIPEDSRQTYEGKSPEDLAKMHYNLSKKLGEQGKEIGELRKISEKIDTLESQQKQDMTMEEIVNQSSSDQLKQMILQQKRDMRQFEDGSQEYEEAQEVLDSLQTDYVAKLAEEKSRQSFNQEENKVLKQRQVDRLKDDGFEFEDEEWEQIHGLAQQEAEIRNDGLLSQAAYDHAVMEAIGPERYAKTLQIRGEQQAVEKQRANKGKENLLADVSGPSRHGTRKNFRELNEADQDKYLKNLSDDELNRFIDKAKKIRS